METKKRSFSEEITGEFPVNHNVAVGAIDDDSNKVTASGDDSAKKDDIVIEDPGEAVVFRLNPEKSYGGNEKGKLDISSPLWEVDEKHPDYKKVLKVAENIVEKSDAKTLVALMGDQTIHPDIVHRLLLKYAKEQLYPNDNFIKLVDAWTEWEDIKGIPNYSLSDELTDKNWARYYSVLKKAELKLKDKTAVEVVVMVRKGDLHKSVIDRLAKEYISGREIPGDMNEKIKEALNELEK